MTTWPFPLSDALIHAFGWTLLHSLWQGAAIALTLLLLLPRWQSARQRYRTAYAGLLLLLAAALTTFGLLYQPDKGTVVSQVFSEDGSLVGQNFIINPTTTASFWSNITTWLEARHPLIVGLWLIGFGIFLLRLVGGFFWVQQLRRRGSYLREAHWALRVNELASQLGQSRPVALLESALVRVPLTIGWLKPLILLPVGLVNQLDPAEVEAIIAHELAHVVRRDWLLNFIQAFIEALFYYHPAVWWMSWVVRAERENSCDDAAVTLTGNRLAYAKALVRVQEMARLQGTTPVLALGAAGKPALLRRRPVLLERIQRILNQQHKKSQLMEKFIATTLLAALVALWGARPQQAGQLTAALGEIAAAPLAWFSAPPEPEPAVAPVPGVETDSVPKGHKARQTQKITQENDEGRVEMELQDGQITRLNINGQEVPAGEFERHQELTDGMMREMTPAPAPPPPGFWGTPPMPAMSPMEPMSPMAPMTPMPGISAMSPMAPMGGPASIVTEKDDQGNTVIHLMREGQPTEITVKDGEVWIDGRKVEEGESLVLPGESPVAIWNNSEGQGYSFGASPNALFRTEWNPEEMARLQKEQAEEMAQQQKAMAKDFKRQEKEWKKQQKQMTKKQQEEMERQRQEMQRAQGEMQRAQAEMVRSQIEMQQNQGNMERARAEANRSNNFGTTMKNELKRDGLLPDPNHYSVQLNNQELIVNGKKQSDDLHRKYLDIYRQKTGQELGASGNVNIVENRD